MLHLIDNPRIRIMKAIVDGLNLRRRSILDIGCNDGSFISILGNQDNLFHGLEINDWCVTESRKKGIDVKSYFFDDKTPLPYGDGVFDLVIAGEIIEHIFDTDYFLNEVYRVLRPEGRFLISTPNIASFGRRLMLLLGINPIIELSPNETESSGHIRYFTYRGLKTLLRKHGFEVVKYCADVVNFDNKGRLRFEGIAHTIPSIGQSIICLCSRSP